jgi:hypothetical protein
MPASLVGLLCACFLQMRVGKELEDDPEYQKRLADGDIKPIDMSVLDERQLPPEAKRSTLIFLRASRGRSPVDSSRNALPVGRCPPEVLTGREHAPRVRRVGRAQRFRP